MEPLNIPRTMKAREALCQVGQILLGPQQTIGEADLLPSQGLEVQPEETVQWQNGLPSHGSKELFLLARLPIRLAPI